MWLVMAYEAAGQRNEAIALCRQLGRHPDIETRKQSKRLLYILEAPKLERRPEWLTQIPDLGATDPSQPQSRRGSTTTSSNRSSQKQPEPEPLDLSQVNTQDNRFIWIALIAAGLTLGGLAWFSH